MSLRRQVTSGLRSLFRSATVDHELNDEVRHYLEMATLHHMRAGLSRSDAERAARVAFGGVEAAKEGVRSGGWEASIDTTFRDVRYALRGLRRNPAFTLVVVATLALGIGATTAMFSVVNAVMLRPLPYRDPGRLALIWTDDTKRGLHQEGTAYRTIDDWRRASRSFGDVAFFSSGRATIGSDDTRERSRRTYVSANLLSLLGVAPALGRGITVEEEAAHAPVVLISYALWQRRFAGDGHIIGKSVTIEEEGKDGPMSLNIVGVMPRGFYFPDKQTQLWTPATLYWRWSRESNERAPDWARRWTAIGRLNPRVSIDDARAELDGIGRRLAIEYPSVLPDFPGYLANPVPVLDHVAGRRLQLALWLLLAAVGLVLLVACANVASLALARGAARQHEFAVRRALGAGRARLARQLLIESLVLAGAGGAVGILVATMGTRILARVAAAGLPRLDEISTDGRVLAFAAAISVLAGLLFGVFPAVRMSATDASEALKEGRAAGGGVGIRRTRSALVLAECCFAVMLLAGAGLLLRSLARLHAVDPGFDPARVLTMRIEFPREAPETAEERTQTSTVAPARAQGREQKLNELVQRISAMPGVTSSGFTDDMFISGQPNTSITIPGRATTSLGTGQLNDASVTPGFFGVMRVPLRRGRLLTRDDARTKIRALWSLVVTHQSLAEKEQRAIHEPVVVNEAFVRSFFPNDDPLGKTFCIDPTNKTYWYVIVGVVGDMHRQGLERETIPEYFGAFLPSPSARADLMVRTTSDPLTIAATVRQLVNQTMPHALIPSVSTADRELGDQSAERTFQTSLLTLFAVLALGLAAVGIYGVVHYAVAERTREIGVRIALGASASDVVALVVRQGMRVPLVGVVVGVVGALAGTRVMSHLLFGVTATDPVTFGGVVVVLFAVALVACLVPARRASHLDPVMALRRE